ncbi:hypothetical protein [Brevundimonas nasdae]|uniref:Lipoprotein n=1 Tax=Brevundimonas nasdae TaxID=172043 RepID=A0ABX8TN22_9CAUL|nr:hypothetical protein [Brevundimonas nasdae]QYC11458.1 hypothetical protein KWG56_05645 [Brevundimonas nasdae]QYC14246.1 hypothetical protein KWG63_00980 [Brevundimonas nasdae]
MSSALFKLTPILFLAACIHHPADLPVCNGEARRPANPHGSILAPATEAAALPSAVAIQGDHTVGGCR